MATASTPRRAAAKPAGDVTYEIVFSARYGAATDKLRLTFPASCKVTYGTMHGGNERGGTGETVLRIYDSNEKQRAMFRNVESFRDLSFFAQEEVAVVDARTDSHVDSDGSTYESSTSVEKTWKNLD